MHSFTKKVPLLLFAFIALLALAQAAKKVTPSTADELRANLKPFKNKSVFWLGRVGGKNQKETSGSWAKANGDGYTLQRLAAKQSLVLPFSRNDPNMLLACVLFAEKSTGKVRVLQGQMGTAEGTRYEDSIWWNYELPGLTKAGTGVTEIEEIDLTKTPPTKRILWKAGEPQQGKGHSTPKYNPAGSRPQSPVGGAERGRSSSPGPAQRAGSKSPSPARSPSRTPARRAKH